MLSSWYDDDRGPRIRWLTTRRLFYLITRSIAKCGNTSRSSNRTRGCARKPRRGSFWKRRWIRLRHRSMQSKLNCFVRKRWRWKCRDAFLNYGNVANRIDFWRERRISLPIWWNRWKLARRNSIEMWFRYWYRSECEKHFESQFSDCRPRVIQHYWKCWQ